MSHPCSCKRNVQSRRQNPEQHAKSKDQLGQEVEERPGKRLAKVTQNQVKFWERKSKDRHVRTER